MEALNQIQVLPTFLAKKGSFFTYLKEKHFSSLSALCFDFNEQVC